MQNKVELPEHCESHQQHHFLIHQSVVDVGFIGISKLRMSLLRVAGYVHIDIDGALSLIRPIDQDST